MTPQQIADYRMSWYPGFSVFVHSDREVKCRQWCHENLQGHEWTLVRNTDVYEHTFRFEHESHARAFQETMNNNE